MKSLVGTTFLLILYVLGAIKNGFKVTLTLIFPSLILSLIVMSVATPAQAFNDYLYESSSFSRASRKLLNDSVKDQKFSALWSIKSRAESYSDATDDSFLYSVGSQVRISYSLLERLEFKGQMDFSFRGGRVQARFGDFVPNGINLSYGYFDLEVFEDHFSLLFGALNQRGTFSDVVMSYRAFPGLGQELKFKGMDDQLEFSFGAQQVIPTSYSFNTELVSKEDLPSLMTLRASVFYEGDRFNLGAYAGFFSYSDLPSKVADSSRFLGNTVRGTGSASEFVFGFEGWTASLRGRFDLDIHTAMGFSMDVHENTSAPDSFNQSQLLRLFLSRRLNKDIGLDLTLANYFIESDAVPGYYTPTSLGNTNRKGNYIELGMEWVPHKLRVSGRYVKSDLINVDTTGRQYDADFIFINLETSYDTFF